jgi:hypothetical protein
MKKFTAYTAITVLVLTPLASAQPEITYTDFYQKELKGGEDIVFGIQVEDSTDVEYSAATLKRDGEEIEFTPLLDRNGDDFFAGSLGPVEGGNTYTVELEACNVEGECTTETSIRKSHCRIGVFGNCLS